MKRPWLLIGVTTAPLAIAFFNHVVGDIPVYFAAVDAWKKGALPYAQHAFEYPPYALFMFGVPALAKSFTGFRALFMLQILALDIGLKRWLLRQAALWPFLAASATALALEYIYLKRFDLVPAVLTLAALALLLRQRALAAGLCLGASIPLKLYPLVLVLPLLAIAWRQRILPRFMVGGALALLPLAIASIWLPWWHFAISHTQRGMEAETLYAGAIWLMEFALPGHAHWHLAPWAEVAGPWCEAILPSVKIIWVALTVASSALAAYRLWRTPLTLAQASRVMLLPLLAFMIFGYVFSPQYLLWMVGFAACALMQPRRAPVILIFAAIGISAVVFPSPTYATGLDLPRTCLLCVRNCVLLLCWAWIGADTLRART